MHPVLAEVLTRLDGSREGLRAAVDEVPPHLRNQPPAPDRWSVSGVLEHLARVEERAVGIIGRKIADVRAAGSDAEDAMPAMLPSNIEAMLADRSERRQAPEPLHPSGLECDAAWQRLEQARAALRETLIAGDGLALSKVVHEHPRFGPLTPYQWAGFIAAHESRHAQQIHEIAAQAPAQS